MQSSTNYTQTQKNAFKHFSIKSILRCGIPTAMYYVKRPALPGSEKPALFTMNILPPLARVWFHFAKRAVGDKADIVIFDSSGKLDPKDFPGARVQKFINLYAATKSNEFLRSIAKHRRIGWLCDDDVFLIGNTIVERIEEELSKPNTASLSFLPRPWWYFEIDGKTYEPSSSYCVAMNREMVINKEHLSMSPAEGNTHPCYDAERNGKRRYDTFDKANEILLKKGYNCKVIPKEERNTYIAEFHGVSNAVVLLEYFKCPEQMLRFFKGRTKEQWKGSILFRALAGLLTITAIQDLHKEITGSMYPLPSLPSPQELADIRKCAEPYLNESHDFANIDRIAAKLKNAL